MAELGLAAAPVPSITVTFLRTVLSAITGEVTASSAATVAPSFKPFMFHSPKDFCADCRCSYGRPQRKKTSKTYAALRHRLRQKIMPPSGRRRHQHAG